jgi:glycosyltransferase involved in cell wall biosynthesis
VKISIVVPSFNQASYLEETLLSVLDQGYPDLELIVCDGGSTDGTREILERHGLRLAWWCSERDRGQTDAINKGLHHATGEIWSYLNSDDLLEPGSLNRVAAAFADPAVTWIGGISTKFDSNGNRGRIVPEPARRNRDYLTPWSRPMEYIFPCSNVSFMRRAVVEKCGYFDESLHYGMDIEYYTRAVFAGYELTRIPEVLGHWRWHDASKTMTEGVAYRFLEDELKIAERYLDQLPDDERSEVVAEIIQMRRHLAVRRALHRSPRVSRPGQLARLVHEMSSQPSLLWFRPWLGAVRQTLFS